MPSESSRWRNRAGIMIETVGSWLDDIPAWPLWRSKNTLANLDAEEAAMYARWDLENPAWRDGDDPVDDPPRRQWFGVISGWGCRLGICRFGISMQNWWREAGYK